VKLRIDRINIKIETWNEEMRGWKLKIEK
jgi:hypothetical protein